MDLLRLDPFASDHHGLITRAAARRAGMPTSTWYRAHERGLLQSLHPNVSRMLGAPVTAEQTIAAAVLAAGGGALASHRTAAYLWGIPGAVGVSPVDVLLVSRTRGIRIRGADVHRPRDQIDLTPVLRARIPTTNILRTLCDLGVLDAAAVPGAVGHVVTTGMVKPGALHRAVWTHSRRGRPGVPALRAALETWEIDGKPADSVLEPAMRALVRSHGLPPVEFHPIIGGYEVDFRIVGSCLLLECDGWGPHVLDRRTWERDKDRDTELGALGFVTMRFTYRAITRDGRRTATAIRRLVERWAPHLLGADVPDR